jgi:hypothetical protein
MDHPRPPPIMRPTEPPAPVLTKHGRCSDCNTTAVWAGDHDLKVCPDCFALLWHEDWSAEERLRRQEAAARAAAKDAAARAAREAAREAARQERAAARQAATENSGENKDHDPAPPSDSVG